jgi:dihydroorotase
VRAAKAAGVRVTAVHAAAPRAHRRGVRRVDPVFKINPPLAARCRRAAGLLDGTIGAIATDHAPRAGDEGCAVRGRRQGCWVSRPRSRSLTTLVEPGFHTADALGAVVAASPCRGLAHGHGGPIAAGRPANLCVIDPTTRWVVDANRLASRSTNSPWHDWKLTGKVRHTLLRGVPTVRDSEPTQ